MTLLRLFRGDDLSIARARRTTFDPAAAGVRYRLRPEVALEIWNQLRRDAEARAGDQGVDDEGLQRQFHAVATRVAARSGLLRPDVGRTTLIDDTRSGSRDDWFGDRRPQTPGRSTRVLEEAADAERMAAAQARSLAAPTNDAAAANATANAVAPKARSAGQGLISMLGRRYAAALFRRAVRGDVVDLLDPAVASALQQRGSGQPLTASLRGAMEIELGVSLSGVRLHTDAVAAVAAHALGAEAFTFGEDIYFADGRFAPDSAAGKQLLAHELTHVAQVLRGAADTTSDGLRVSDPDEPLEREAHQVAERVARAEARPASEARLNDAAGDPDRVAIASAPAVAPDLRATTAAPAAPDPDRRAMTAAPAAPDPGRRAITDAPPSPASPGVLYRAPAAGAVAVLPDAQTAATVHPETQLALTRRDPRLLAAQSGLAPDSQGTLEVRKPAAPTRTAGAAPAAASPLAPITRRPAAAAPDPAAQITHARDAAPASATAKAIAAQPAAPGPQAPLPTQQVGGATPFVPPPIRPAVAPVTDEFGFAAPNVDKLIPPRTTYDTRQDRANAETIAIREYNADRSHAASQLRSFRSSTDHEISSLGAVVPQIDATLGGAEASALAQVSSAAATQRAHVQSSFAQAIEHSRTAGAALRETIERQALATSLAVVMATMQVAQRVTTAHQTAMSAVDSAEAGQLGKLDALYEAAKTKIRSAGTEAASFATTIAEQRATEFLSHKINREDNFWDGHLTDKRCDAQAKAAREVGKSYADELTKAGSDQADQLDAQKPGDQVAIRNIGNSVRDQLDKALCVLLCNIDKASKDALDSLQKSRTDLLKQAEQSENDAITGLEQGRTGQLAAVDHVSRDLEAGIRTERAATAAALRTRVQHASDDLRTSRAAFLASMQGKEVPEPGAIDAAVASTGKHIAAQLAAQREAVLAAAASSAQSLHQTAATGRHNLDAIGASASASASDAGRQTAEGFSQFAAEVTKSLTRFQTEYGKGLGDFATKGESSLQQIGATIDKAYAQNTDDLQKGFDKTYSAVRSALLKSVDGQNHDAPADAPPPASPRGLEQKPEAECCPEHEVTARPEIPAPQLPDSAPDAQSDDKTINQTIDEEAKKARDKVQPRWKAVLMWVITAIVTIVVAVVLGPMVVGAIAGFAGAFMAAGIASAVATVVGGAVLGAATSFVLTLIDNGLNGRNLLEGMGMAVLMGVISGAAGGGIGSLLAKPTSMLAGAAAKAVGNAGKMAPKLAHGAVDISSELGQELAGNVMGEAIQAKIEGRPADLSWNWSDFAQTVLGVGGAKVPRFERISEKIAEHAQAAGNSAGVALGGKPMGAEPEGGSASHDEPPPLPAPAPSPGSIKPPAPNTGSVAAKAPAPGVASATPPGTANAGKSPAGKPPAEHGTADGGKPPVSGKTDGAHGTGSDAHGKADGGSSGKPGTAGAAGAGGSHGAGPAAPGAPGTGLAVGGAHAPGAPSGHTGSAAHGGGASTSHAHAGGDSHGEHGAPATGQDHVTTKAKIDWGLVQRFQVTGRPDAPGAKPGSDAELARDFQSAVSELGALLGQELGPALAQLSSRAPKLESGAATHLGSLNQLPKRRLPRPHGQGDAPNIARGRLTAALGELHAANAAARTAHDGPARHAALENAVAAYLKVASASDLVRIVSRDEQAIVHDPNTPVGLDGNPALVFAAHGDPLAKAAAWLRPVPGKLDVVVHGTSDKFLVRKDGKLTELGVDELAALIHAHGGAGQDIRLISCETGSRDGSVAQKLADKLGVKVDAPSDTVWITPDGRLVIGKNPFEATGTWSSFAPEQARKPGVAPSDAVHAGDKFTGGPTSAHDKPGAVAAGRLDDQLSHAIVQGDYMSGDRNGIAAALTLDDSLGVVLLTTTNKRSDAEQIASYYRNALERAQSGPSPSAIAPESRVTIVEVDDPASAYQNRDTLASSNPAFNQAAHGIKVESATYGTDVVARSAGRYGMAGPDGVPAYLAQHWFGEPGPYGSDSHANHGSDPYGDHDGGWRGSRDDDPYADYDSNSRGGRGDDPYADHGEDSHAGHDGQLDTDQQMDGEPPALSEKDRKDQEAFDWLVANGVVPGDYALIWSKTGAADAEKAHHFTDPDARRQLAELAVAQGRTPILVGDKLEGGGALPKDTIDLGKFWDHEGFPFADEGRLGQLRLYRYLAASVDHDVVSIGMRSGALEGPALMGIDTIYMEEHGNKQAARMEKWLETMSNFRRAILSEPPGANQKQYLADMLGAEIAKAKRSPSDEAYVDFLEQKKRDLENSAVARPGGFADVDYQLIDELLGRRKNEVDAYEKNESYQDQFDRQPRAPQTSDRASGSGGDRTGDSGRSGSSSQAVGSGSRKRRLDDTGDGSNQAEASAQGAEGTGAVKRAKHGDEMNVDDDVSQSAQHPVAAGVSGAELAALEKLGPEAPVGLDRDSSLVFATEGDPLIKAAGWLVPVEGKLDVLVHGASDKFLVRKDGAFVELGVDDMVTYIRARGGDAKDVRLIACKTGADESSIAQQLADKLGAKVDAPSDTAWITPDGRVVIGKDPFRATGTWNTYTPNKVWQPGSAPSDPVHADDKFTDHPDTADGVVRDSAIAATADSIKYMTQAEKNRRVAKFAATNRETELHAIVADTHLEAIAATAKKHHYVVAIRETGALSIKRIKEGAKAKPHTILEKSIKESSLEKVYGTQAQTMLTAVTALDLDGFVGHWSGTQLLGVRVDRYPPAIAHLVVMGAGNKPYIPLDLNAHGGGPSIVQLKNVPGWKTFLYTGDYDLHEVHRAGAGGGQIPEASLEKVSMLNQLNAAIAAVDPTRVGRAGLRGGHVHMNPNVSQHAMFQHGDQATYRMNQHLEAGTDETGRPEVAHLVQAVATESNEPIAWCRFGEWFVTRNAVEHQLFRDRYQLKKPHTWSPEEDERTASGSKHNETY